MGDKSACVVEGLVFTPGPWKTRISTGEEYKAMSILHGPFIHSLNKDLLSSSEVQSSVLGIGDSIWRSCSHGLAESSFWRDTDKG